MGTETKFSQGKSRRGLYGTSGVDTNSFGGGGFTEEQGIIEISIKAECRKPEKVFAIHEISQDKRFINWFNKKASSLPMSFKSFAESCPSEECERITSEFLEEEKIAIIQDHLVDKSFYIRDRNCIETIKGTPKELFEIFSENNNLRISRCGSHHILTLPNILLRSLAKHDEVWQ